MNLEDRYDYMREFCRHHVCSNCPVDRKNPNHECGAGRNYDLCGWEVSPEELNLNYNIATEEYRVNKDAINPDHYKQGGVECIEALKSATTNLSGIQAVCTANAIKYLWRWKGKNGVEDLKKAIWYIQRLISEVEGEEKE